VKIPQDFFKGKEERSKEETSILSLYDVVEKRELQRLMYEDLKARIEERLEKKRLKERGERESEEKLEAVKCPCNVPQFAAQVVHNPMTGRAALYCGWKAYAPFEISM